MEAVTSRWVPLVQTMPSGRQLWVCRCCGRVSAQPEARCPEPATVHGSGPPHLVQCDAWERITAGGSAGRRLRAGYAAAASLRTRD